MRKRPKYERQSIAVLRRQIAGTIAKANGRRFEEEVDATCDIYRQRGIAAIARNHPMVAGPPGHMWYAGKGEVDFIGHAKGIPIAFDAKSCAKDARSWRYPPRDLHQVRFLIDWLKIANGKAHAFVLLRQQNIAYILLDLETLVAGNAVILREKQKHPKGGTELAESPKKLVPYVTGVQRNGMTTFDFLQVLE